MQHTAAGSTLDILLRPTISIMSYLINYTSSSYSIPLPSADSICYLF